MAMYHDSDASVEVDLMDSDDDCDSGDCAYRSDARELHIPDYPITELDKRGDKIIIVGSNNCRLRANGMYDHEKILRFRVCSRALARASPVMAAMLFGSFSESTQEVIDLPADNADTMGVLLRIAHGDFAPVSKVAGIYEENLCLQKDWLADDVYKIALLANKYLMTPQLRPWAASWIPPLCPEFDNSQEYVNIDMYQRLEKAMFIACHWGNFVLFQKASERLVWVQERNQEQFTSSHEPFSARGGSCSTGDTEIGAADHLRNLRVKVIDRLLKPLRDLMTTLQDDTLEAPPYSQSIYCCASGSPASQKDCHMHTLGVVVRFLNREGLYPLPDAADVDMTPRRLHHRLTRHTSWPEKGLWSDCPPLHPRCQVRDHLTYQLENANVIPLAFYAPPQTMMAIMESRAKEFGFPPHFNDIWE